MFYFVKTPWWLRKIYSSCVWRFPGKEKVIYLTFDDGPHPNVTPFVLNTLKLYNAKATFFCIGKNVLAQPLIYKRILLEGHAVGNHTFNHLNGWKTVADDYINNVREAEKCIDSPLFRPPYGRITKSQLKLLSMGHRRLTSIMWTVLSGDFDVTLAREKCLKNVLTKTGNGSIVVFHDSEKAFERMTFALPKMLEHFTGKGYRFEAIRIAH
ncbi:MAG: polysaccharide deacetylase family protein [Ferruginibacter sp.]|nr:polysaccharide deacetylase family protein [Ferruginibacter sp.]